VLSRRCVVLNIKNVQKKLTQNLGHFKQDLCRYTRACVVNDIMLKNSTKDCATTMQNWCYGKLIPESKRLYIAL